MSFLNPKYLKRWRANLTEHFNLLFGRNKTGVRAKPKPETLPKVIMPNKNLLNGCFKTKSLPQARNYISYLREWRKKNPPTPPEVIRKRMEAEIRRNKKRGVVDLRKI